MIVCLAPARYRAVAPARYRLAAAVVALCGRGYQCPIYGATAYPLARRLQSV